MIHFVFFTCFCKRRCSRMASLLLLSLFIVVVFWSNGYSADWQTVIESNPRDEKPGMGGFSGGADGRESHHVSRQRCTGEIQFVPREQDRPIRAGDLVTIVVILDTPREIGRVDITTPEGTVVASREGDQFKHWWTIPQTTMGQVPIQFSALSKDGDEALCAGMKSLLVLPAFQVKITGDKTTDIGNRTHFTAAVSGAEGPFLYQWDFGGEKHTVSSESLTLFQPWAFKHKGEQRVSVTVISRKTNEETTATASLTVYSLLKVNFINEAGTALDFIENLNKSILKKGQPGKWVVKVEGGTPPFRFEFNWDGGYGQHWEPFTENKKCAFSGASPNCVYTVATHAYSKDRCYAVTVRVINDHFERGTAYSSVWVKQEKPSAEAFPNIDFFQSKLTVVRPSEKDREKQYREFDLVAHLTGKKAPKKHRLVVVVGKSDYYLYGESKNTFSPAVFEAGIPVNAGRNKVRLFVKGAPIVSFEVKGQPPTHSPPTPSFLQQCRQQLEKGMDMLSAAMDANDGKKVTAAKKLMISSHYRQGKAWFQADHFGDAAGSLSEATLVMPELPGADNDSYHEYREYLWFMLADSYFRTHVSGEMLDSYHKYIQCLEFQVSKMNEQSEKRKVLNKRMARFAKTTLDRWILLGGAPDVSETLWETHLKKLDAAGEPHVDKRMHPQWRTK